MGSGVGTINQVRHKPILVSMISSAGTDKVVNSAIVTASSPGQTNNVSDTSDDGDDNDGNTTDDSTDVSISPKPSVEATKTATVSDTNGSGLNDPEI